MNIKEIIIVIISTLCFFQSKGQNYEVEIIPMEIENLGGLQSYAVGTFNGEWLIVGGRLDGLHRRQPFASFSSDGKNQDLIVVNPTTKTVWRRPLSDLGTSVSEQLSSTNMQFYQVENRLICTGGYGFSPTANDHVTFPYLTVIDLPVAIQNIKDNSSPEEAFAQVENEGFRVTGGALNMIDDIFYLVGGHKFMGRYNPMGPDHGPGFEQEYTNEIRKFSIDFDGPLSVEIQDVIHDEMNLHRRDYNLVPYLSDDERELMIYSGVFKTTSNLPWLYPVSISNEGHSAHEEFNQYYNHYHCAHLPIYNKVKNEMNTIFFGGIAQFYEDDGWLVQDNDVPFVNTITEINQDDSGVFSEVIMSDTMPGFLGAGSVFIFDVNSNFADDGILDAEGIGTEFETVGYIYGGIRSSLPNIFWDNTGIESSASSTVYKVSVRNRNTVSIYTPLNTEDNLYFFPNPAENLVRMSIDMEQVSAIEVSISNEAGMNVGSKIIPVEDTNVGKNIFVLDKVNIGYGAFYYTVKVNSKVLTRKVIWSE